MSEKDNFDFENLSTDNTDNREVLYDALDEDFEITDEEIEAADDDIQAAFDSLLDDIKKSTDRKSERISNQSDQLHDFFEDNFFKDMKVIYEDNSTDDSDPGISRYLEAEENEKDSLDQSKKIEKNPYLNENTEHSEAQSVEPSASKSSTFYIANNSYLDLYKEIPQKAEEKEEESAFDRTNSNNEQIALDNVNPLQEDFDENSSEQTDTEASLISTIEETKLALNKKRNKKEKNLKEPLTTGQLLYKIAMIVFIFIAVCCALYLAYKFFFSAIITNYLSNSLSDKRITETNEDDLNKKFLELQAKYPDVVFPEGIIPSLWVPYAENQDTIGWLTVEGLDINYPVVQTNDKDNANFYLRRDFYTKKYSVAGTLFLSRDATIRPLNKNLVIFGHRMDNGTMFGKLKKYKSIDGYKASPIIKFDTLYEESYWKIYAVFLTNALEKDDNGYTFNYTVANFASDEKFVGFVNELDQRKFYSTSVDINKNDTLLTLSTCDHDFNEARLVVVARKVRPGESIEIDTSLAKAKKESDIKYPQAWYDKKGKTNPFKNTAGWTP